MIKPYQMWLNAFMAGLAAVWFSFKHGVLAGFGAFWFLFPIFMVWTAIFNHIMDRLDK